MSKKKRPIVCCDGTWNELTSNEPTNVIKTARLIRQTAKDNEEITKEFQITPDPKTEFDDKVKLLFRLGGLKLRSITGENINIHGSLSSQVIRRTYD